MTSTARILTWNVERKHPVRSPLGAAALDFVFAKDPDVLVLTESSIDTPVRDGHVLCSARSTGEIWRSDERKVLLWSHHPWLESDSLSINGLPDDSAVWGTTETPIGTLRVLGLCIPWHMAGARYAEPKRKQWEVHIEFLEALAVVLKQTPGFGVVAGDFNQLRPRTWGSKVAEQKLLEALAEFTIATEAPLPGCVRTSGVDHVAIAPNLVALESFGWPNKVGEQRFSDHEGAGIVLARKDRR